MRKVTLIVPVYNSEKYINKCLDSILNQTYKNYEILVVNDGSKDNSQKIIDEYASKYPEKIITIEQENKGVAITRNESIKKANGDYIMFIDNDDYIDKEYIETFVEELEEQDYDVVIGGYRRPTEENKIIRKISLKNKEWSKFMILAPWAKIYKRKYLIENHLEFLNNNIGEDVYFNMQALQLTNKIKIINYIGYNWFFNTQSVSNTSQKNYKELNVFDLLDKTYNKLKKEKILDKNYEINELYFYRYIIWFLIFSMKKTTKKEIYMQYDKMFDWLEKKFPEYRNNKLIGIGKPEGETKSLQFLYIIFRLAQKIGCGKGMLYLITR